MVPFISFLFHLSFILLLHQDTMKNLLDPLDMKNTLHLHYCILFMLYRFTFFNLVAQMLTLHYILRNVGDGFFFPQAQYKNLLIQAEMMELRTRVSEGLMIKFIIRLHIFSFDKIFKLPEESDVIMQISAGRVAGRG